MKETRIQIFYVIRVKISFSHQMLLSVFVKYFLVFALLICASCNVWQTAENTDSPSPHVIEEIKTGVPFENKEPEIFQTEIVATNFLNGEKTERRYFLARNGAQCLTVFNRGERGETSVLQAADGRTFFINNEKKSYQENQTQAGQGGDGLDEFLTTQWLNQKTDAAFENLGTENNLTKYRVRLADSNVSEILIVVDENLKLPVKQEFYSIADEQKTLMFSVELQNFSLQTEDRLFELPKNYQATILK